MATDSLPTKLTTKMGVEEVGATQFTPEVIQGLKDEFDEVMIMLDKCGDPLNEFKAEYAKLFKAFAKSNESNERLMARVLQIAKETREEESNVAQLDHETKDAQNRQAELQKEIQQILTNTEQCSKETTDLDNALKAQRAKLEDLKLTIDMGPGWTEEQTNELMELQKQRDSLDMALNERLTSLQGLRTDVQILHETASDLELKKLEMEKEHELLKENTALKEKERDCVEKRKVEAEERLKELKVTVEQYRKDLVTKTAAIDAGGLEVARLENELKGAKGQMEQYLKEYDSLFTRTHKLTSDLDDQVQTNTYISEELKKKEHDLELLVNEIEVTTKETSRVQKLKELVEKKLKEVSDMYEQVEKNRSQLREEIKAQEREALASKKQNDSLKKALEDLVREREVLNKAIVKTGDKTKETDAVISVYCATQKNLENEIHSYKSDAFRDRQSVEMLEEEVKKYEVEAAAASQRYFKVTEVLKLQENQIADLQKKILHAETKLKQQQNLYETVRSERNMYSKSLIESQEDITAMKRRFQILNHEIEQLKEEITSKDHQLVKEHFEQHKVEKETELLKSEWAKVKNQIQSSQQILLNQEEEVKKLSQIISEAQEEAVKQQKEYLSVISERDLLGGHLTQRNNELSAAYEKIKIQSSSLKQGELHYTAKKKVVSGLEKKLDELQRKLVHINDSSKGIEALEKEVVALENDLIQERSKVKALSDELERPLNIHRWRKLEGRDPERYALIRKINSLQKSLIEKTEQVIAIDVKIKAKEKAFEELKSELARQPGPEVAAQLEVYEKNLNEKLKLSAVMKEDLKKCQNKVDNIKKEMQRINQSMLRLKESYFKKMRKERLERELKLNTLLHEDNPYEYDNMFGQQDEPDTRG